MFRPRTPAASMLRPDDMAEAGAVLRSCLGAADSEVNRWAWSFFGVNQMSRVIGHGGFGVVVAGTRRTDGAPVAIKFQTMPTRTQINELACLSTFAQHPHPNVIKIWDLLVSEDKRRCVVAMAMPRMFLDLRQLMAATAAADAEEAAAYATTPLGWPLVKSLACDLVKAVRHMHSLNLLHRDIKPRNCGVAIGSTKLKLQLMDFGVSRGANCCPGAGGHAPEPMTMGVTTLWYSAPEALRIAPSTTAYSKQADVWSAAMTMGELFFAKALAPAKHETHVLRVLAKIIGYPSAPGQQWARDELAKSTASVAGPFATLAAMRFPHAHEHHNRCATASRSLLQKCIRWEPGERLTAEAMMLHPFFEAGR